MKIYTKQEWDAIINPIIQNKNTSDFETACSYFRQICQEIGKEISNPEFKGGYDEMVNFYNHSSYKTDRGLQLAIAWTGCNDLCKYEAKKIGLTSPLWWHICWYMNINFDFNFGGNYTWLPTDYILVVTGCENSDYNGEYKLLDTSATGTTKEWHHTTNNYRIVWSDDHWIFTSKSDYMTYYYSNKVTYPWDATWHSTHEGDLTEIKVIKKSDLIKVVFTLSGSSNNQVNGEFIQTAETAWQTGQNASYTNGKVYVWYNSSFNCWFCTYVLGDATSSPPLHASNGTGDNPWSVADGWNGVTCSRDIIFSVTGFSKYAEGANGDYLQTADTVGKVGADAVYTNGPYYFFVVKIHLIEDFWWWCVSPKAGDYKNGVSHAELFSFTLNPWENTYYRTICINEYFGTQDTLTFTMGENGDSDDEPDDIPIPANGFKVTGVTSPASLNGVYSLTSGDISDLSSCQWTNENSGHLKYFSGGYWIFGDSTNSANTPDDCFYWSHGGIDGKKPWEITSWSDGSYSHSGTLTLIGAANDGEDQTSSNSSESNSSESNSSESNSSESNSSEPLTLTAEQANSTVKLTKTGSPTVSGLQYRTDSSGNWKSYTIDTVVTLTKVGDYVQFQNTENTLSKEGANYVKFNMTGKIAAIGNIQSMLNWSDSCSKNCYAGMFLNCTSLTQAPELPATLLALECYAGMFLNCTSLTQAPELPATLLLYYCYANMFKGCTSLTQAPELPATTLDNGCYHSMFFGCTSLTQSPELPATTLANNCYGDMFLNCNKLNNISVGFTEWHNTATSHWVSGVASSGTFVAPSALPDERGYSRIPEGWTFLPNDAKSFTITGVDTNPEVNGTYVLVN